MQVLCNIGRAASAWRADHWNYNHVVNLSHDWAYFTPIRFI